MNRGLALSYIAQIVTNFLFFFLLEESIYKVLLIEAFEAISTHSA